MAASNIPPAAVAKQIPGLELRSPASLTASIAGKMPALHGVFTLGVGTGNIDGDLDLLVRSSEQNVPRILKALEEFGFGAVGITEEDLLSPGKVIQLGVQPNRIDILSSISGISFDEAWASRQDSSLEGIPTHFIGLEALIRNKRTTVARET